MQKIIAIKEIIDAATVNDIRPIGISSFVHILSMLISWQKRIVCLNNMLDKSALESVY